jgi:hypothetical protein
MARENQGLQIALIIFVMLTIILGVTTFIFFRQYEEADQKAQEAVTQASQQLTAANTIQDDNNRLKGLMGFTEKMEMDEITAKFNEDMSPFVGTFPEEACFYSPILSELRKAVDQKSSDLVDLQARYDALDAKYRQREQTMLPQIQDHAQAKKTVQDDLTRQTATFKSERARIVADQTRLQDDLQKARESETTKLTAIQTKLDEAGARLLKLAQLNQQKSEKLESIVKETFEEPDGEIRWVNQRDGTVWINLGRADALARQVSFAVYPADTTNLAQGGKKASVEVTQILGEHLAEARVVEDTIADPIMPGDKVHTPIWAPGQRKRFALAGLLDADGDGKSDQQLVRNLITMNGGVVDCYTDENGQRKGTLSVDTRYLVLGKAPTAKGQPGAIKAYSDMIGETNRLGIQKITLGELLQKMGWRDQTPVVEFGRGANPDAFRPKPPRGGAPVSSGNVSGLFQPRRPPANKLAPRSGGAY